jgi:CRP/FNR family transcriptional regulator
MKKRIQPQRGASSKLPLTVSLRDHSLFKNVSSDLLSRIERYVYHREYEPRQIIYFPEDHCDFVYLVHEGQVKITRQLKTAGASGPTRELTLRHLFPGDLFGEECLMERSKREAYAEAVARTVLFLIRAADFRRMVRDENELTLLLARHLIMRVNETEQVLAETTFKTVRGRVAASLVRLRQKAPENERAVVRVTHQEIANLVGSTRETTSAVLHDLRDEGVLRTANRRVAVLDPAALERIARSS